MNKNWLTYLFVISLALLWSCGAADTSSEEVKGDSVSSEDSYAEGENEVYAEATEEAATEEVMEGEESYENAKEVVEEESYTIITTDQLVALQGRAEQKVKELFEYITIMSNDKYDMEMRKNAKKMAVNLFDNNSRIYAPSITGTEDSVAVKNVLKDILKQKIKLEVISIEDIDVADDETVYCKLIANNVGFRLFFKLNMEFENKQFGDESIEVWSVYFGNVKED